MPSHASNEKPKLPLAPRSAGRRWTFRCCAVIIALSPFVLTELYLRRQPLRSGDAGDPILDTRRLTPLFVQSADGDRWEIPASRFNFFRPASFPVSKEADVRRIFVLGGSTVQGRPYETETAFSTWVQLRLQASDPKHRYEVVNCGGVSYASYRLAIILKEVLQHSPDAIVLYTGHNEFLEERSYATLNRGFLQRLAESSRLVSAIRSARPLVKSPTVLSSEVRTRLDGPDGLERYVRDSDWRDAVVEHFGECLGRMVAACEQASVPLVLCQPACDLVGTPPFKEADATLSASKLEEFKKAYGIARDDASDDQQRLDACRECLSIDGQHAGANYIAGMLHWQRGDANSAKRFLERARDADVCPLRAITKILDKIQAIASAHRISLIRCDLLFDELDPSGRPIPDGIADPGRFVDHVHPTIKGHQIIGREVAQQLAVLLNVDVTEDEADARYEFAVREHIKALDESYFARGKQRLEGLQQWAAGRAGELSVQ